MRKRKFRPWMIGAFVLGAVLLGFASVLVWGSRSLFEQKYEYVCYFDGSVNGLSNGSPVKYRGVDIGSVGEIRIRYHQAPDDARIPVLIDLWGKRLHELGGRPPTPETARDLIARGLRARLASTSIITGVLYVNLDMYPNTPIQLAQIPGSTETVEIPTLPTPIEEVTKSVTDVLAQLKSVDLRGIGDSLERTAANIDRLTNLPELRRALSALPPAIVSTQRLMQTLETRVAGTQALEDESRAALAELHRAIEDARTVISPQAPLAVDLARMLADVDKAAVAVRDLAELLQKHPNALIAGKPAPGRSQ
jgi:paraquat-inducible protein B